MKPNKARAKSELEHFSFCSNTNRLFDESLFPRVCHTCEKKFINRIEFLKETNSLPKGSYSKGTRSRVFEYRNCTCGSTLVIPVESNRDNSEFGAKMRAEYSRIYKFLKENGIDELRAKEISLEKIRIKRNSMME